MVAEGVTCTLPAGTTLPSDEMVTVSAPVTCQNKVEACPSGMLRGAPENTTITGGWGVVVPEDVIVIVTCAEPCSP